MYIVKKLPNKKVADLGLNVGDLSSEVGISNQRWGSEDPAGSPLI